MTRQVETLTSLLSAYHRDLEWLFGALERVDHPERDDRIVGKLVLEMLRHFVMEERYLHPVVTQVLSDGGTRVQEERIEREHAEEAMRMLERVDLDDQRAHELLHALRQGFERHVELQEEEVFPALERALPKDQLAALATAAAQTREIGATHSHPVIPGQRSDLLTPREGLVDRIHNALWQQWTVR